MNTKTLKRTIARTSFIVLMVFTLNTIAYTTITNTFDVRYVALLTATYFVTSTIVKVINHFFR